MKEMGLKETGILTSVSDYHIFLKLNWNRRKAMDEYLGIVKAALEMGIKPRCHMEDVTRADIYGFCVPFAIELMKLRDESGIDIKLRLCDTMGYGVPYPGAALPRSVPKLVRAMIDDAGVPGHLLEWHGHNDFHKVMINATTAWLYSCTQRRRDHGGLIFVDLRDRDGLTQVVFDPKINPDTHIKAGVLRDEFVLAVRGVVNPRPPEMINPNLPTGEIEIVVAELRLLNSAKTPPFELEDYKVDVSEALRLKYRYLDLRRPSVMKNILFRHRAAQVTRQFLNGQGFIEVETPILTKSTPEGARDYLVPSRVQPGQFFALPQSPQLFKQLLMMAGMDRYYQLCRCFRDEDLRADRQPEFTQIDMEMAFISEEDIMRVVEGLIAALFKELLEIEVPRPFPRLTYRECMDRFGLDRPDLRFGLGLRDLTDLMKDTEFRQFREVVDQGGVVKALKGPGLAKMTRKELDELIDLAGVYGARGLAWVKVQKDGWQSPLAKYFPEAVKAAINERLAAQEGDLILFVADTPLVACTAMGQVRLHLGQKEGLIPEGVYNLVWVTDFPVDGV